MSNKLDTDLIENLEDFDSPATVASQASEAKENRKAALWLCLACLSFYLLINHGFITSQGYDEENFYTAKNLVENGKANIYNVTPILYARNGILQPLVMIPWYLVTKLFSGIIPVAFGPEWMAAWFNPILTTLIVLYVYLFILKLGFGRQAAVIGSLLAAFTSMLVPYSQIGLETFQTLSTLMAAYYIYSFKLSGKWQDLLWCGLASGLLLGAKQTSFLLVLPIGLYTLYALQKRWGWRNKSFWLGGILWLVPIAIVIGIVAWFYTVRLTIPRSSALTLVQAAGIFGKALDFRLIGLYSYIFSLNKSFFLYSPTVIMALFAFRGFWRSYRPEALLFAGLTVMALIFPSLTVGYGDEVWGPRYIHTLVPLGYIIGARLFQGNISWTKWRRRSFIALALFAGFVQFLGSLYWYGRYAQLLAAEGLSSQISYGEVTQSSQLLVQFQLFVGNVTHIAPNSDQYLEYRAYYFPIPDPAPKLVSGDVLPRLDLPKVPVTSYAIVEQWAWKVWKMTYLSTDVKIVALVICLIMFSVLVLALVKLRRFWRNQTVPIHPENSTT